MEELEKTSGTELVPYERGLSFGEIVQASAGRFLPGAVLSFATTLTLIGGVPGSGEWLEALTVILAGAGALTLGFSAGLEALRRWLYPDAKVNGRRSFIAGVVAPAVAFIVSALLGTGFSMAGLLGVLFLVSLSLAVLMFFAWLTPTPEELRDSEYEHDPEVGGLLDAAGAP